MNGSKKSQALASCAEVIEKRKFCYELSPNDKGGEDCLVEELEEKRCLAMHLCKAEATSYYGSGAKGAPKAVCSLW